MESYDIVEVEDCNLNHYIHHFDELEEQCSENMEYLMQASSIEDIEDDVKEPIWDFGF